MRLFKKRKKTPNLNPFLEQAKTNFGQEYLVWRANRVSAIISHFSPSWFNGKKILELGCAFGDIGEYLHYLSPYSEGGG